MSVWYATIYITLISGSLSLYKWLYRLKDSDRPMQCIANASRQEALHQCAPSASHQWDDHSSPLPPHPVDRCSVAQSLYRLRVKIVFLVRKTHRWRRWTQSEQDESGRSNVRQQSSLLKNRDGMFNSSFARSFAHSLFRSFVNSFIHSFIHCPFKHSFITSFVHTFVQ